MDVTQIDETVIPDADVWLAGFPCQDVSLARMGARSGLRGTQSGLFYELMRLIRKKLPRVVVLENVDGLLSSHGGRDFAIVLKAMDECGYSVGWRVLNSKDFGVPQQRRRVFIVAMHRDPHGVGRVLLEPECGDWNLKASRPNGAAPTSLFQKVVGNTSKGPLVKALAHCVYAESARHTGTDWSRNYVWYPDGRVRRLLPVEVERIQGFPDNWTVPAEDTFRGQVKDSMRYHAVGNAVTPQVSEWLGHRILDVIKNTKQRRPRKKLDALRQNLTMETSASNSRS